jgi:hypothetical protein
MRIYFVDAADEIPQNADVAEGIDPGGSRRNPMSDPSPGQIDLQAILAKIRRDTQESDKFIAEQRKLIAEAAKLERDRAFLPWSVAATLLGAGAALFAAGAGFIKLIGG